MLTAALLLTCLTAGSESLRDYPRCVAMADSAVTFVREAGLRSFTIEVRGALPDDREGFGRSSRCWGVTWGGGYEVMLRGRNTDFGDFADSYVVDAEVCRTSDGRRSLIASKSLNEGIGPAGAPASIIVEIAGDSAARIFAGGSRMIPVATVAMDDGAEPVWGIRAEGRWVPEFAVTESVEDPRTRIMTGWTADSLGRYLTGRGRDRHEGYWRYFDRKNDPDLGRCGGRYRLATVCNADGGYDIIYVSGAEVNSAEWTAGMLKGRLVPTIFPDHYDLIWTDAVMDQVTLDANATIVNDALLEINFPLYETMIRFSRERP